MKVLLDYLTGAGRWPPKIDDSKIWQEPIIETRRLRIAWGRGKGRMFQWCSEEAKGISASFLNIRLPIKDSYVLNCIITLGQ